MIDACREDRDVLSRWDQLSHVEPRIWVNETEAAIAISELFRAKIQSQHSVAGASLPCVAAAGVKG